MGLQRAQGNHAKRQQYPVGAHFCRGLPIGRFSERQGDRGEPERRRRLRACLRQDCAARQGSASPDQFATYGHHSRELFRRGRLPKYVAVILVTGGTGFIGTHLLEMLAAKGESVRGIVRTRRPRRTAVPRSLPAGVETVYGDLVSGDGVADALRGADVVIHLAGVTKALRPEDYYRGNVHATGQLVRAMAGRGMRLVHVSSLAAIGPATPDRKSTRLNSSHL